MPGPDPSSVPPGIPERVMFGLAFIATGAALSSWFDAFRLVGVVLILIGLAILFLAVWSPLRWLLISTLTSSNHKNLALWILGGGVVLSLVVGGGWIATQGVDQPRSPGSFGEASLDVTCVMTTGQCVFTAAERNPGEPLVWFLPPVMTEGASDGVLAAQAWIEGEVAGRYVALACRVDSAGNEYVLAVRPENQSFRLIRWEGGVRTQLAGDRLPAVIRPANQANDLRLECRGSMISAFVNGTRVATTDVSSAEGGWYLAAGIFAENTQPASLTAHFDQIAMQPEG